ncbi:30S ribosomal protein S6 [Candidatus Saccharibacteria bacterium]|nr:30S ribosomal protein S6 [Candidatus Saccharibacteria bacterium]
MKEYELTVLFHPDLEMNLDPALDKVKKLIENQKGTIKQEEADGKKRIAYPVKGQEFAVFHYFVVELPAEAPAKISSVLNITDEVLRHLLVRVDERKAKLAARRAEKAANEDTKSNEEKGA